MSLVSEQGAGDVNDRTVITTSAHYFLGASNGLTNEELLEEKA